MLCMVLWSLVREERVKVDDELHSSVLCTHSKRKIVDVSCFNSRGPERFSIPLMSRIGREGDHSQSCYLLKILCGS